MVCAGLTPSLARSLASAEGNSPWKEGASLKHVTRSPLWAVLHEQVWDCGVASSNDQAWFIRHTRVLTLCLRNREETCKTGLPDVFRISNAA